MSNPFFPCIFINREEQQTDYDTVITSDFHYFDSYFGDKGCAGYGLQQLAKKLAKQHQIKELHFDSEAGMFCAYSANRESLLRLCQALREISGEESQHTAPAAAKPKISVERTDNLLLRGFILRLDPAKQQEFLDNVPFPALSPAHAGYIAALEHGTEEEKIRAVKRIESEARSQTRRRADSYLAHPYLISLLLAVLAHLPGEKLHLEILYALRSVCDWHLPDLRCREAFYQALTHKKAAFRYAALYGLLFLYEFDVEKVKPLLHDKAKAVREAAEYLLRQDQPKDKAEDIFLWRFDDKAINAIREEWKQAT